jgi:hypothetical protein
MSKAEFLSKLAELYRAANTADAGNCRPIEHAWMRPDMAGDAGCAAIDRMTRAMVDCGAMTSDELEAFYSTL